MTAIRSVFDLPDNTILVPTTGEDRKLHIRRLHMVLAFIEKCQDKSGNGWEALWHEFYNRTLQFLEFSNLGGEKFISTAPQLRLKHEFYKGGLQEAHSVIVQHAVDCSREAIENALSQIYSEGSIDESNASIKYVLADLDINLDPLDLSAEGFEPLATSSRPSSPHHAHRTSPKSAVVGTRYKLFPSGVDSASGGSKETESQDQRPLPPAGHPLNAQPPHGVTTGPNSSHSTIPARSSSGAPADLASKTMSFQYMEASHSINWDPVERKVTSHAEEVLRKLEVQIQARIPDYVSFVRLMHDVGSELAWACFPLLITELKALGVIHDEDDAEAKIWLAQNQISWQAALCMKQLGAQRVFSMCGAGLYVQFALWDMRLMTADLECALQESDPIEAGRPVESSGIVSIFNAAETDYSDRYKYWMNRIVLAGKTRDLEVPDLTIPVAE